MRASANAVALVRNDQDRRPAIDPVLVRKADAHRLGVVLHHDESIRPVRTCQACAVERCSPDLVRGLGMMLPARVAP